MIVNKFNGNGGGGSYTLPTATESRLGGVKIGSGITVQNDGTISASGNTYTLPAATSEVLGGVKIGEGISIDSAGTISVSGVSAEEKYFVVDALSAVTNPTEGMAVYVKGEEITGYTILCDTTELENYSWEPGRNFINIDGNDYEFAPVGNLMPGKWRTMSFIGFSDLMARIRMTAEKYTILDVIDSGNTHTIAAGSDMVSITSGITFPMKGSIYVYASGRWNRKSQFEWVYKQSEAAGVYSAIMSGVEEFGLDDFTIRFDPAGNDNLMEFKFYRGANWGLDFKSVDSRANCDWNYINVYNYRLISDGSFVDIIGPKTMSVDESILEQVPTVSTINVDSAGTITAGWDSLGILSSMNYAAYRLEFAWDGEQDSKWGIGQLKYWFRQNETVSDETKLYYYVCAEVPIDGVLYKGLWKWAEWDYPDPFTAQSWTQVQ